MQNDTCRQEFVPVFGSELHRNITELVSTQEALKDVDVIGAYFGASWCQPCESFTNDLIRFYNHIKVTKKQMKFEIIFISYDKNEEAFKKSYQIMPWLAVKYTDITVKKVVSNTYKINGVPIFILIDGITGNIITKNADNKLASDPNGHSFPWLPQPFSSIIGDSFLSKTSANGTVDTVKDKALVADKIIILYFAARNQSSCDITQELVQYYKNLKQKNNVAISKFEVIYISYDCNIDEFNEFVTLMPWLVIPFDDNRIDLLKERYDIEQIPSLVIIDNTIAGNGSIINKCSDLLQCMHDDPEGLCFPYYPEPIKDIDKTISSYGYSINIKPSLVLLMEHSTDAQQQSAIDAIKPYAIQLNQQKANNIVGPDMLFFTAFQRSSMSETIRRKCNILDTYHCQQHVVVILDLLDHGGYYMCDETMTINAENIGRFIDSYRNKTLNRKQWQKE